jgi:glutaryl-CoA dehydrogenase (non-decarboxylating)
LDRGRLSVSAGALGVAQACLDEAVKYARERVQFGHPIGTYQMVQSIIAEMTVTIEAARFLVCRLGCLLDQRQPCTREAAMAKFYAGEVAVQCANLAAEVHGGYGYSEEYKIARLFRDAKMYQIGEGTANILKILIANDTLGYKKANRASSA